MSAAISIKNARVEETCLSAVKIAVMMRPLLATCAIALWAILALRAGAVNVPRKNPKVPPGFVTTSGSRFELDGKPFVSLDVCSLAVANAYHSLVVRGGQFLCAPCRLPIALR